MKRCVARRYMHVNTWLGIRGCCPIGVTITMPGKKIGSLLAMVWLDRAIGRGGPFALNPGSAPVPRVRSIRTMTDVRQLLRENFLPRRLILTDIGRGIRRSGRFRVETEEGPQFRQECVELVVMNPMTGAGDGESAGVLEMIHPPVGGRGLGP